jgi:tol-pal system protein YbgF
MKPIFRILFLIFFIHAASAQVNPGHKEVFRKYAEILRLYQDNHIDRAYREFLKLRNELKDDFLRPDIDFYITLIEINSGHPKASEKIDNYLIRYPNAPYRDRIRVYAIDKKFNEGRYKEVQRLIDVLELYNLPAADRERMEFYKAFIALKNNDLSKSKRLFKNLSDSKNFGNQAKYYLGYIAYLKGNTAEAQRYFSQVEQERKYAKNIPYYNADMYYRAGLFRKAIEEAGKIYSKSRGKQKSELAKIIGSSYFNLGEYDKAIPYLKAYRGKKGKFSNKDYYELGYAYYKSGKCSEAINYFNKIISANDALAQNAYYHLGKCYLSQNKKTQALNAFKRVAEMDFDKNIREDAWYQYIKLSYESGNPYESLDTIIRNYLTEFPASVHRKELKELLISSYLTARNYEQALEAMRLNKMTDRPEFQKVAVLRGLELFNEGKYNDAIRLFDLSLKHGIDPLYRNKAGFWKAEALFRLKRYKDALVEYKSLDKSRLPHFEKNLYDYNTGYVYFKLKDYPQAAKHFSAYISGTPDGKLLKDAYLRLGDSYFGSKKYWPAMDAYNQAIKMSGHNADYAFYQKAVSYGFVGKTGRKIEELNKFLQRYPKSKLVDDALYQLGSTYLNQGKFRNAVSVFDRLINRFPGSPYVAVALLKKGLAYYNTNDNTNAKKVFKELITKYPRTAEAAEAAGYLKSIYIDENNVDGFLAFINKIPGFNVESSQLENEIFSAAEQKYFENDYTAARTAFASYLKRFPDGIYKTEAIHYLAKIYLKLNEPENAYKQYELLAGMPVNEYTVEALRYLALENLKKQNDDNAIKWLEKLKQTAQTDDDLLFAVSNLMKIYDRKGLQDKAVENAQAVLNNPKHDNVMASEAKLILARAAVKSADWNTAERYYDELLQNASGKIAAEALYYKALFQHKRGEYDQSNKTVAKLSKKYPSHKEWSGKALIVMARNMKAKGDIFNATYILENVIKRFDQYPGIVNEARTLLQKIKSEQSEKNEDIPDEIE